MHSGQGMHTASITDIRLPLSSSSSLAVLSAEHPLAAPPHAQSARLPHSASSSHSVVHPGAAGLRHNASVASLAESTASQAAAAAAAVAGVVTARLSSALMAQQLHSARFGDFSPYDGNTRVLGLALDKRTPQGKNRRKKKPTQQHHHHNRPAAASAAAAASGTSVESSPSMHVSVSFATLPEVQSPDAAAGEADLDDSLVEEEKSPVPLPLPSQIQSLEADASASADELPQVNQLVPHSPTKHQHAVGVHQQHQHQHQQQAQASTGTGGGASIKNRKGVYHHLPPMSEQEKAILFDALPSLRQLDEVPPHSADLRSASLAIIRAWFQDKLAKSKWVSLVENIKVMAEGTEHTNINQKQHILQTMGMDARSLHTAGIPPSLVHRIYKALWVYSLGMHELVQEVSHHAQNNHVIIGNIWKCYAILLEDFQGDDYVMALLQVEAESQRVLKAMEERFGKSLQLKKENEIKTQSEVKTLSSLLERSQMEARALLEKKESLTAEIHHLETANSDLERLNQDTKKQLWFNENALNRLSSRYDDLVKSSKQMEQKLLQDILDLKVEQEELKASLDRELKTNEKLSLKVDNFSENISELNTNTSKLKAELNEARQETNLSAKVLEKVSHDLARVEQEKEEALAALQAKLTAANARNKDLEVKVKGLEELERAREEREKAEKEKAELMRLAAEQAAASSDDAMARHPLVIDLHAQLAFLRKEHDKQVTELEQKNEVLTERIRAGQRRIKQLGGRRRFTENEPASQQQEQSQEKEDEFDSGADEVADATQDDLNTSNSKATPQSSRRRGTGDGGSSDNSASSSKDNSRRSSSTSAVMRSNRSSLKASTSNKRRSGSASVEPRSPSRSKFFSYAAANAVALASASGGQVGGVLGSAATSGALANEVNQLHSELESKEKLNTNLLMNINKLKVSITQLTEESKKQAERMAGLKTDLSDSQAAKDKLSTEKVALQTQVVELEEEIAALRKIEKAYEHQNKLASELAKHKNQLVGENAELSSQLAETKKELKVAAKELKNTKTAITSLKEENKNLQSECDNRIKNQNELGLRVRTLQMENQSLQSVNDEIQRNLKTNTEQSSLLGSLESKSNEINRLFLKIREMEHAKIELLKSHEKALLESKTRLESETKTRLDEALEVEHARAKKLRTQITEQKTEYTGQIAALRAECEKKSQEMEQQKQEKERAFKDNEKLNKVKDEMKAKLEAMIQAERKKNDQEALKALAGVGSNPVPGTQKPLAGGAKEKDATPSSAAPGDGPVASSAANVTRRSSLGSFATAAAGPATSKAAAAAVAAAAAAATVPETEPAAAPSAASGPSAFDIPTAASLLSLPALSNLGISELNALLSGETAVNSITLAEALKNVSVRLAETSMVVMQGKEARNRLEEVNFMYKNEITVLQETISSLKRAAEAADAGPSGPGPASLNRKRRTKKTPAADGGASSSSEDELVGVLGGEGAASGRRGAARKTGAGGGLSSAFSPVTKRGSLRNLPSSYNTGTDPAASAASLGAKLPKAQQPSSSSIKSPRVAGRNIPAASGAAPAPMPAAGSTSPTHQPMLRRSASMDYYNNHAALAVVVGTEGGASGGGFAIETTKPGKPQSEQELAAAQAHRRKLRRTKAAAEQEQMRVIVDRPHGRDVSPGKEVSAEEAGGLHHHHHPHQQHPPQQSLSPSPFTHPSGGSASTSPMLPGANAELRSVSPASPSADGGDVTLPSLPMSVTGTNEAAVAVATAEISPTYAEHQLQPQPPSQGPGQPLTPSPPPPKTPDRRVQSLNKNRSSAATASPGEAQSGAGGHGPHSGPAHRHSRSPPTHAESLPPAPSVAASGRPVRQPHTAQFGQLPTALKVQVEPVANLGPPPSTPSSAAARAAHAASHGHGGAGATSANVGGSNAMNSMAKSIRSSMTVGALVGMSGASSTGAGSAAGGSSTASTTHIASPPPTLTSPQATVASASGPSGGGGGGGLTSPPPAQRRSVGKGGGVDAVSSSPVHRATEAPSAAVSALQQLRAKVEREGSLKPTFPKI